MKKTSKVKKRVIKAWAFLATGEKGAYFIKNNDSEYNTQLIYLKRPPKRQNPLFYYTKEYTLKPTPIEIHLKK